MEWVMGRHWGIEDSILCGWQQHLILNGGAGDGLRVVASVWCLLRDWVVVQLPVCFLPAFLKIVWAMRSSQIPFCLARVSFCCLQKNLDRSINLSYFPCLLPYPHTRSWVGALSYSLLYIQHTVCLRYINFSVSNEWNVEVFNSFSLLARYIVVITLWL